MTTRATLLVLAGLAGCAPAATPPSAPPSPIATSVARPSPEPPDTPLDARTVRCGLDDRPKSVVGARDVSQPFLAEMLEPPPLPAPPALVLTLAATTTSGPDRTMTAAVTAALGDFAACAPVFDAAEANPHVVALTRRKDGSPLTARPHGDGVATRFDRCLADRVCQLRLPADGPVAFDVSASGALQVMPPTVSLTGPNPLRKGEIDPAAPNLDASGVTALNQRAQAIAAACATNGEQYSVGAIFVDAHYAARASSPRVDAVSAGEDTALATFHACFAKKLEDTALASPTKQKLDVRFIIRLTFD